MLNYSSAVIDMDYVTKLQDRYDAIVLDDRVVMLVQAGDERCRL